VGSEQNHLPVLLNEAIDALNIMPDGIYIDCTYGRGGHSEAILEKLGPAGKLIAIDKDPEAIKAAEETFKENKRFTIVHDSYAHVDKVAEVKNVISKVDGILIDSGVSSPQLDEAQRGFSFLQSGPLDMRMDPTQGESAASWIEHVKEEELVTVLKTYGEERFAKRIANFIVKARDDAPITDTKQLAEIITKANPKWERHKHPATRSFQAIRIFINSELDDLQACLENSIDVLAKNGRLVVISFHSLEDRIVKQFIRKEVRGKVFPVGLPVKADEMQGRLRSVGKAIKPSEEEIAHNPRARSAVLRVAEKLS